MGNDFDLNGWLGTLDLSEDERKVLEPVLAKEPVSKKIRESFLMRSDYSKKMDGLNKQKEELEAQIREKVQSLEEYHTGLVTWKGDADKIAQKNQAEIQRLTDQLKKKDAAMLKIAEDYGLDTSAYVQPDGTPNPTVVAGVSPDILSKYVDTETFQKAVRDAQSFPDVAAELMDLNAEHMEIFGKPLKGHRVLVAEAIKQKKSLRDVWAAQNKVDERRQEMAKAAHDEEIERVKKETEMRVRSELKIPAQRPDARQPLILSDKLRKGPEERQTGQASDRSIVEQAMAAYSSGKYAESTE